jgi:hypothetical protein
MTHDELVALACRSLGLSVSSAVRDGNHYQLVKDGRLVHIDAALLTRIVKRKVQAHIDSALWLKGAVVATPRHTRKAA